MRGLELGVLNLRGFTIDFGPIWCIFMLYNRNGFIWGFEPGNPPLMSQ